MYHKNIRTKKDRDTLEDTTKRQIRRIITYRCHICHYLTARLDNLGKGNDNSTSLF